MGDGRRPDFRAKVYADREDRHGVEIGAAWTIGGGGIRVVLRGGVSVHGAIVLWPLERDDEASSPASSSGGARAPGVPF